MRRLLVVACFVGGIAAAAADAAPLRHDDAAAPHPLPLSQLAHDLTAGAAGGQSPEPGGHGRALAEKEGKKEGKKEDKKKKKKSGSGKKVAWLSWVAPSLVGEEYAELNARVVKRDSTRGRNMSLESEIEAQLQQVPRAS